MSVTAIIAVLMMVNKSMNKTFDEIMDENTRDMLNVAMLSIENQYNSLKYQTQYAIEYRKTERKNIMSAVVSL